MVAGGLRGRRAAPVPSRAPIDLPLTLGLLGEYDERLEPDANAAEPGMRQMEPQGGELARIAGGSGAGRLRGKECRGVLSLATACLVRQL
jgi:hypothetical protein